jgi:hypothetical protein
MARRNTTRYLSSTLVVESSGDWLSANTPFVDTSPRGDDRFYVVRARDRLDELAYRFFGDQHLWWVIAEYNEIFWFQDLEVNQVLRLPSFEHYYLDLAV